MVLVLVRVVETDSVDSVDSVAQRDQDAGWQKKKKGGHPEIESGTFRSSDTLACAFLFSFAQERKE